MSYIYVEENDLTWAAQQGLVTPNEATALWPALVKRTQGRGNLNLAQVAFYAGSLLIIGALSWFMTVVWASSEFLFFLALAYSAVFGAGGVKLWFDGQAQYGIPQAVGGLFVTIAVAVAPIATFAAQRYFNEWPISDGILIELTLVAGGALAFYFIRFPFLTAPIAAGLYGMSTVDLSQAIWHHPSVTQICLLSFAFGLAMDAVAFGIDRQKFQQDYGFWLYLFGTASSFGALTWLFCIGSNLLGPYNCGYAIFSALYIVAGALANRQSVVVFGSLGEAAYVLWLTNDLFYNSWSYPFVLTAVGLLIIFIGIQVQKYISNQTEAAQQKEAAEAASAQPYQPVYTSDAKEMQFMPAHYMPLHMQAPPQPFFFAMPAAPAPAPVVAQAKTVDV